MAAKEDWPPSLAVIQRLFDRATLSRAQAYVSGVRDLSIDDAQISARSKGTQSTPYRIEIESHPQSNGRMSYRMYCSCPMASHCKHCAAVLLAASKAAVDTGPSAAVLAWAEQLRQQRSATAAPKKAAAQQRLFYTLQPGLPRPGSVTVTIDKGRIGADGLPQGATQPWSNIEQALRQPFAFMTDADAVVLRLLWLHRDDRYSGLIELPLAGGAQLLRSLLATGRLGVFGPPNVVRQASLQDARTVHFHWAADAQGRQRLAQEGEPPFSHVVAIDEPWFIDDATGAIGPLRLDAEAPQPALLRQLMHLPPLTEADVQVVSRSLEEHVPTVARPKSARSMRTLRPALLPRLTLASARRGHELMHLAPHRGYRETYAPMYTHAAVQWRYVEDGVEWLVDAADTASADTPRFLTRPDGTPVRIERDGAAEARRLAELTAAGLQKVPHRAVQLSSATSPDWGLHDEAAWRAFDRNVLPRLVAAGWQVTLAPDYAHHRLQVDDWHMDLNREDGHGEGWMLALGIDVNGRRVDLAPLLADLLRRDPRWLDARAMTALADDVMVDLIEPDGTQIEAPVGRIRPIVRALIDLLGDDPNAALRLTAWDAARLDQLDEAGRWFFHGGDDLRALAERLRHSNGVTAVKPPRGLALKLRPYQLAGLAWLQFLRAQDLAGILADDMGLGKTAQALAHLLVEKNAGRLDRPALVVLPTSLVFNWTAEAARITPGLRVLSLHGKDRQQRFAEIDLHDLVLTTYPLLWRDIETLKTHDFHLLVLDEAQMVKNAASRSAEAVRQLRARHRLCLTGTPLENHLGELWSQFDFLLPGFLGSARDFTKRFRTPIEKRGDTLRAELLARRVRPFILRRRKDEVATELPAKSVVIRRVALEGAQRDLYETVRVAADARVSQMLASQGFERSQIAILDALLKLRQVCCDPLLVKKTKLPKTIERAKMNLLRDMLPELIEEGRRVLVLSQFTEMLALIETLLAELELPWLSLTGETPPAARGALVKHFQSGEVPLFLISLKAGGVGLNLTAADTVIHVDPWWNPAAEDQATDRAHRIGQDKPVFVYKLVVEGSIEERILAMQERKAQLARGVLGSDAAAAPKFTAEDLAALLAPLQ